MTTALEAREALTREEAAELYGVSFSTIKRAIHAGHLRAKRVGVQYRVSRADLRAWWDSLPDA